MTALQNLEVGLNFGSRQSQEPLLLYQTHETPQSCMLNDLQDRINYYGNRAVYQCHESQQGKYCTRRATNGNVYLSGALAAYAPRTANIYNDCMECLLSCQ